MSTSVAQHDAERGQVESERQAETQDATGARPMPDRATRRSMRWRMAGGIGGLTTPPRAGSFQPITRRGWRHQTVIESSWQGLKRRPRRSLNGGEIAGIPVCRYRWSMTQPPAIAFDAVSKTFGGRAAGARRLSLAVPAGEFVALVGGSGSGKTTLLRPSTA